MLEELLRRNGRIDQSPFSEMEIDQFLRYYELVLKWNPHLHLTTLTDPDSFFMRHLQESSFAEGFILPEVTQVWDLGSGLGVPGIPLAILRKDLSVNLVESNRRKAIFLDEAASFIKLSNLTVVNSRIESLEKLPPFSCLTARAVEQMKDLVHLMLEIGANCSQMLFFGSEHLKEVIESNLHGGFECEPYILPQSDRRLVISLTRST